MSDGNFNRQLLPKTELSSGLRAGKAQMRVAAERAFDEIVKTYLSSFPDELKAEMRSRFTSMLK